MPVRRSSTGATAALASAVHKPPLTGGPNVHLLLADVSLEPGVVGAGRAHLADHLLPAGRRGARDQRATLRPGHQALRPAPGAGAAHRPGRRGRLPGPPPVARLALRPV